LFSEEKKNVFVLINLKIS